MTEEALYEQIARYLNLKHPGVPFHFDLSGMWTPSHKARNLYGRLNKRAWPDLFIPVAMVVDGEEVAHGLFLELKREGTRLKTRDGRWASTHIEEQDKVLSALADQAYVAQFAVGYDEAVKIIDEYLAPEWRQARIADDLPF